jgi:hypothetical protein
MKFCTVFWLFFKIVANKSFFFNFSDFILSSCRNQFKGICTSSFLIGKNAVGFYELFLKNKKMFSLKKVKVIHPNLFLWFSLIFLVMLHHFWPTPSCYFCINHWCRYYIRYSSHFILHENIPRKMRNITFTYWCNFQSDLITTLKKWTSLFGTNINNVSSASEW